MTSILLTVDPAEDSTWIWEYAWGMMKNSQWMFTFLKFHHSKRCIAINPSQDTPSLNTLVPPVLPLSGAVLEPSFLSVFSCTVPAVLKNWIRSLRLFFIVFLTLLEDPEVTWRRVCAQSGRGHRDVFASLPVWRDWQQRSPYFLSRLVKTFKKTTRVTG